MELTAALTLALLIEYFIFMALVGAARGKTGVSAPAMTGDPFFERTLRVQQNTLEQLIHVIPSLWICSYFLSETIAVGLGTIFLIGRIIFCITYRSAAEKRTVGFVMGWAASAILLLAACWGVISSMLQ